MHSLATGASRSAARLFRRRVAPRAASFLATVRPIPEDAPVMRNFVMDMGNLTGPRMNPFAAANK